MGPFSIACDRLILQSNFLLVVLWITTSISNSSCDICSHWPFSVCIMSSVTWPFDSPNAISYNCSIATTINQSICVSSCCRDNGP